MTYLRLGITSKGRLHESTISWLSKFGLDLQHNSSEREYYASFRGVNGLSVSFLSAGEIPQELAMGRLDLGVTGQDLICEKIPYWKRSMLELELLGFGYSRLVMAVPTFWVDIDTLDDFD